MSMKNFRLVPQEGVDGSGGVGGFQPPPKITKQDKAETNPFRQRVWPLDMPSEKELKVVFADRPQMIQNRTNKKRKFGNRRDDFVDYAAREKILKRDENLKRLYEEALPFLSTSMLKSSVRKETTTPSLGIACMDPMWERTLGTEVEVTSWMSRDDVNGFHGWKLGRVEAVRWSRDKGGCVKLAVRLNHNDEKVLEGVPMDCVRLPSKVAEARERAKRRNTSSSRRRKAVPQSELAPPHLRLPPGSALVTQNKLPPGWSIKSHTRTGGGIYYVYVAPDDTRHRSIAAVNRYLGLLPPGKRAKKPSSRQSRRSVSSSSKLSSGEQESDLLKCIHCGRTYKQQGSLNTHIAKCSANNTLQWTTYVTQVEDETLTTISSLPGAPDVQSLIEANRDIYRGITAKSRLMKGTQIFLRPIEDDDTVVKTELQPPTQQQQQQQQQDFKTVWNGATPALGTTVEALWASGSDPQYPGYLLANVHSVSKDPQSGSTFLHLIYHDGGEDTEVPIRDVRSVRNSMGAPSTTQAAVPSTESKLPNKGAKKPPRRRSRSGSGSRRRIRCGDCEGCLNNVDCQQCTYCLDKPKYGGPGRLKQCCLHRRCKNLRQK